MAQKYRRKIDHLNGRDQKRKQFPESKDVVPGQQKKKKKKVVGVVRDRFYPTKNPDSEIALLDALLHLESSDADTREKVFKMHREAIQLLFNKSSDLFNCVPGFFDSPIHCQMHFEYIGATSLLENIESDFGNQFELLKSVLEVWCRTEAFKQRMKTAELQCKDLQRSRIPLYVSLIRELSFFWHQELGGFIRYPEEEEQNSPHLLCRELPGAMEFEFHMEQKKILSGMTLSKALASFFHISFIGQLKYPPRAKQSPFCFRGDSPKWTRKVR